MAYSIKEKAKSLLIYEGETLVYKLPKSDLKNKKHTSKDVDRFITEFKRQRNNYYGTKVSLTAISKGSRAYSFFDKASKIAKAHKVSAKIYIRAQVDGLTFINKFPTPSQLVTDGAEQRLLEYVKKENVRNEKLPFCDKDQNTSLKDNKRYMELADKYKRGDITRPEAVYLAKCQKARKGKVNSSLREFLRAAKDRKDSKKT